MSASAEGRAGPVVPSEPLAGQPKESDAWAGVAERVEEYLRAMGVVDAFHLELLSARARRAFQARMASAEVEEPMELAIEVVNCLLDDWLDAELDLAGDRQALLAARAAVLRGAIPGWAARFSGVAGKSIAAAIRVATVQAVPEPAPLAMEPSPILLCCYGLRHRVAVRLRRLVGGMSGRTAKGGPRA